MPPWAMLRSVTRTASRVAGVAGAEAGAPEHVEQARLREFRGAADAAVLAIHEAEQALGGLVEEVRGPDAGESCRGVSRSACHEERSVLLDLAGLVAEDARDLLEDRDEGGPAVAGGRREVGAAPDRLAVGREEHGERPAALLAEGMERRHVDLVDVGPLLAIDLDVHEKPVHHGGGCRVLEALVGHDVAPMAGGVADREKDRLVGRGEPRRGPPGPRGASGPDCPCAGGGRGWLRGGGGSRSSVG